MANEPFLGSIFIFAGNFNPRGYLLCQGQLLSIAQNTALFSILGTTYGGDGVTTFALPDLRGRAPVGQGTGRGLPSVQLGETAGSNSTTILSSNMPPHTHPLMVSNATGNLSDPTGNLTSVVNDALPPVPNPWPAYVNTAPTGAASPASIGASGGGQPISIQSPYLGLNYIIATQGIFPSRN